MDGARTSNYEHRYSHFFKFGHFNLAEAKFEGLGEEAIDGFALREFVAVLFAGEVEVLHVVRGTEKGVNTSCIGKLNLRCVLRPVAADAYE